MAPVHIGPLLALKRRALRKKLEVRFKSPAKVEPARVYREGNPNVRHATKGITDIVDHQYEPTISVADGSLSFVTARDAPEGHIPHILPDDDIYDFPVFLVDIPAPTQFISDRHEQPVQGAGMIDQSETPTGPPEQSQSEEEQSMEVSYHNRPHFEEQSMQIDPPQQSQSSPTVRPGLNRHELVKEVRGREKEIREQLRPGRKTRTPSRNTSSSEKLQDNVSDSEAPPGWRAPSVSTDHETASDISTVRQQPQPGPSGNSSGSDPGTAEIEQMLKKSPNRPATAGDLLCIIKYIKQREAPSHRTRDRRIRSSLSARRDAAMVAIKGKHNKIKRTTPRNKPESVLGFKKHVRVFAQQMMHRRNRKDPFPRIPGNAEQAAFVRTGRGGPTVDDFRVDVTGEGRQGAWNTAAAYVFADEYVKLANAHCRDAEVVKDAFLTHIHALCKQYKQINKLDEDPEAVAKNVRRARRLKTAHRRLEVIMTTPELEKHLRWFDRLGIDGHSGDISAHKPKELRYIVQRLPWRSKELDEFIRVCELIHVGRRYGRNGRPKPGGIPRTRIRQDKVMDRAAELVSDLPENCYAPEVLAAMLSVDVKRLNIRPPVSLTIPRRLLRRAEQFAKVDQHNAIPLPDSLG